MSIFIQFLSSTEDAEILANPELIDNGEYHQIALSNTRSAKDFNPYNNDHFLRIMKRNKIHEQIMNNLEAEPCYASLIIWAEIMLEFDGQYGDYVAISVC